MALPEKLEAVVRSLSELNAREGLVWEVGPEAGEVTGAFLSAHITLSKHKVTPATYRVDIEVIKNGQVVESGYLMTRENGYDALQALYASARRQALRVDETLDSLLDELRGLGS